jgi:glutamate synthase (NADPH/NADH) large chain
VNRALPGPQGLYDPAFEHDACGVAFVADMHGPKSHTIVKRGIEALCNLEHRGAAGAEVNTGDGAGILIQMPDAFLRAAVTGFELPPLGAYATGIAFLPRDANEASNAQSAIEKVVIDEGLTVLGWRDMPVVDDMLGKGAADVEPTFKQLFGGSEGYR